MAGNIAEQALAAERLRTAVLMRAKGANWTEVSDQCGFVSPAAALRAVGQAMADATLRAEETADMARDVFQLRLENILSDALAMSKPDAAVTYDADGNESVADDRAVRLRALDEARKAALDLAKMRGVDRPAKDAESGDSGGTTLRLIGVSIEDLP